MDKLKIDKGVPLPVAGNTLRLPLADMKVGDSFFIPEKKQQHCGSVYRAAKRLKIKISTRSEAGGVRVWRVEDE